MTFYERCVRGALRAYKLTLSPLIGRQCRFLPTCSEYAADVLIGHGPWRGALLAHTARVSFEILEADKRPVSAVADNFEVRDVVEVHVAEDRETSMHMLFDAGRSLEERVLAEQFSV